MIAEVASGLVTSLIYDGLRAPLTEVRGEFQRRTVVRRAIAGDVDPSITRGLSERAVDELSRVIGGGEGKLTKNAAEFLAELRKSAISDAIVQLTILNKSADEAYPGFLVIFNMYSPLPFEPQEMFRAIVAAVRYRLENATDDPVLYEVVRTFGADLRSQFHELRAYLDRAGRITNPLTALEMKDATLRVARSTEAAHKELTVETMRGAKRIPITKLVIPARLRDTDSRAPDTPASLSHDQVSIPLCRFRRNLRHAVILGDPGGGKSTSTQLLCYELAKNITQAPFEINDENPSDHRLPIRVVVRMLDGRQQRNPAYSILDYMVDDFRASLDNNPDYARRFLAQILSFGNSVVIFDGLDEILDVDRRRTMATLIEQFSSVYAGCSILVTSRVVGYRDAPLNDKFKAYTLSRFNTEEVEHYAANLIRAIKKAKLSEARDLSSKFVNQTERLASDLRDNPLMLGLMVYIYMERGSVPDNRPEIYKQCSLLMFERWDSHRGIKPSIEDDFALLDLFGHVAVKMFGDPELEEGVDRAWLVDEARGFFEDWYGDRPRALKAAKNLVEFMTGRAWVMCDVGPDKYKFTHRTFMEYFVARHVENHNETAGELVDSLKDRICKGEWDVVCHLALQLAAESSSKSAKICDKIEALCLLSMPESELVNALSFAARTVEYLNISEPRARSFMQTIVDSASRLSQSSFPSAGFVIGALAYHSSKKSSIYNSIVSKIVRDSARRTDREGEYARYLLACRTVYMPRAHTASDFVFASDYGMALWSSLEAVRAQEKAALYAISAHDVVTANSFWHIYKEKLAELYKTHGQSFVFANPSNTSAAYFYSTPYNVVTEAMNEAHYYGASYGHKTLSAMVHVADDIVKAGLSKSSVGFALVRGGGTHSPYVNWFGDMSMRIWSSYSNGDFDSSKTEKLAAVFVVFFAIAEAEQFVIDGSAQDAAIGRRELIEKLAPSGSGEISSMFAGTKYSSVLAEWLLNERSFVRRR